MTAPARLAAPRPGPDRRALALTAAMALLIVATGFVMGANYAMTVVNMGLVSAIMALGLNLQWGIAGLFNIGVMGFVALGGLAAVLIGMPPVPEAWAAGGLRTLAGLALGGFTIVALVFVYRHMAAGRSRTLALLAAGAAGWVLTRAVLIPGMTAVELVSPAATGYLGGLGLPDLLPGPVGAVASGLVAWTIGGCLAAGAAWVIGKTALGLRSDYLAIATLGIAEIILAVLKNEDWLARGVKNVVGIRRPVPYEINLQASPDFVARAADLGLNPVMASTLFVKVCWAGLFTFVLVVILVLTQLALKSPWGRMMRAIRDNEIAAEAMGKDVTRRHLQVFVLGSAILGMAGAMMATLDGQLTPGSYTPLRYTFLVWVMVIVGGSGSNWGAILGGFLIWWLWVIVEPMGNFVFDHVTAVLPAGSPLAARLSEGAASMRLLTLGVILLVVLRFSPRGLIPER